MKIQKRLTPSVILGLIVLSVFVGSWFLRPGNEPAGTLSPIATTPLADNPDPLEDFSNWQQSYSQADPEQLATLTADGLKLARERRVVMEEL